jgi:hypothetical protein
MNRGVRYNLLSPIEAHFAVGLMQYKFFSGMLAALVFSFLLGCQKYQSEKPENISANAAWVGGQMVACG